VSEPLPLFPLNTVLFPGVVMPLHIFEGRYRALMRDLMAMPASHDREFGVVAIRAGYEVGERGAHTIQRVGCAALVTDVTTNADGTFEIVIVGRRRFLVETLDPTAEYLKADVEWLGDPGGGSPEEMAELAEAAQDLFSVYRDTMEQLRGDDVLDGETPRDPVDLSYTLAAATVLSLSDRQALLECPDVTTRLRMGISLLRAELRAVSALPSLPATSFARAAWSPN
jgi:Lon protease-like protein